MSEVAKKFSQGIATKAKKATGLKKHPANGCKNKLLC